VISRFARYPTWVRHFLEIGDRHSTRCRGSSLPDRLYHLCLQLSCHGWIIAPEYPPHVEIRRVSLVGNIRWKASCGSADCSRIATSASSRSTTSSGRYATGRSTSAGSTSAPAAS